MAMPRAYLAGPEVFLPNARELADAKKRICAQHGLEGVFPWDVTFELAGLDRVAQGRRIFDHTVELADTCDLVIANLTPFRGPSMDVGTAIEIGYLWGRGKPVFGYTNVAGSYAQRVAPDGMFVEPFDLVDNLMVEGPIHRSGGEVVRGAAPPAEVLTSLEAFERCVRQAAERIGARP